MNEVGMNELISFIHPFPHWLFHSLMDLRYVGLDALRAFSHPRCYVDRGRACNIVEKLHHLMLAVV